MAWGKRRKSVEELEEELDTVKVEDEISSHKAQIAEREAVISQLKKQYGRDWSKTLGVSKLTDTATLKSFLQSANRGMRQQRVGVDRNLVLPRRNPAISPLPDTRKLRGSDGQV
jgi:hypothetical protein